MELEVSFRPIQHIEIRDNEAMIVGKPVKVRMVASMITTAGATVEDAMEQYNLSRAEVYAALTYYYDYQEEIEAYFSQQEAVAKQVAVPLHHKLDELRGRLKAKEQTP